MTNQEQSAGAFIPQSYTEADFSEYAARASRLRAVDVRRRSRRVADERRGSGRCHAVLADEQRNFGSAASEQRSDRCANRNETNGARMLCAPSFHHTWRPSNSETHHGYDQNARRNRPSSSPLL